MLCVCLQSGGGVMALDTCEATSPLAPVLRGLLLSEQTVLGVRDNKEPKVTLPLLHSPSPSPQRPPALRDGKITGTQIWGLSPQGSPKERDTHEMKKVPF